MKNNILFVIVLLIAFLFCGCAGGNHDLSISGTLSEESTNPKETSEIKNIIREETNTRINKNDPGFFVLYTKDAVDFTNAPKADINIYRWGTDYTPNTFAQAVFREGDGFYIRMECEETDPRAVNINYNDPIYEDSCLEFFVIYMPDLSKKYINTEMNANGAYLCYFCDANGANVTIDTVTDSMPVVTSFKTETSWGVNLYVPLDLIKDAYGSADISQGGRILANFYKCGDKTAIKHYGSWNEVNNETPNFHLPEYFANIEIK